MINHRKAKELGIQPERVRKFIKEIEQQAVLKFPQIVEGIKHHD